MLTTSGKIGLAAIMFFVALTLVLPAGLAQTSGQPSHVFGGFLFNPTDGNSYLAKMQQGAGGEWQFRLPYTADSEPAAFLFLFYLALGHISRLLSWPLSFTFHLFRAGAILLMLWAIYIFYSRQFRSTYLKWFAFILAAVGSGLGWLTVPAGGFTADFWVAEAYPFLSGYANPHFPLSLALMVLILAHSRPRLRFGIEHLLMTLGLALISPFGVVLLIAILGIQWTYQLIRSRRLPSLDFRLVWLIFGGGSILLYDTLAVQADPLLAGWNAQNLTPTPPIFDLLIAFSPALPLALVGLVREFRSSPGEQNPGFLSSAWLVGVVVLILLPFNLQRRMLIGLYIPLAGLATAGLDQIAGAHPGRFRLLGLLVLLASIPTNMLVIFAGFHGITTRDPALYLSADERDAFIRIEASTPMDSIILAAPETGLWIPAQTGRRVIYGHPFETVNAEAEKEVVTSFFDNSMSAAEARTFLHDREVDLVFYGPRERALGDLPDLGFLQPAGDFGAVMLFQVNSADGE